MSKDIRSSNVKDLDAVTSATGTDLVPVERNGRDIYLTAQQIADLGGGTGGAVSSVNGQTGTVVLGAADVSADDSGAAAAAQAASQPLDADLTAIAALTTTSTGRDVLTSADAAAIASKAGLGNVTNTSDANKPVSTAQQTALDLKANLASPTFTGTVTIPTGASITAPTGLVKGDVGLGNVDNTADSAKTFTESQVTNLVTDLSDLQTSAAVQAAKQDARAIADGGYFCYSSAGCALTPNGTPTKLDMAAGVVYIGTTELVVAAQSAISTTIASLADATNPKWVVVELDTSAVVQFNQGTAAAAPAFPTLTTTRVPLGFLYVPANATNVDALLTTNNGNAKLIDARNLRTGHPARKIGDDRSATSISNPASLTTLLASTVTVPANSLSAGDLIDIEASGRFVPGSAADTTVQFQVLFGSSVVFDVTTATLTKATNGTDARQWYLHVSLDIAPTVSSFVGGIFVMGAVQSAITADRLAGANGAAGGEVAVGGGTKTIDATTSAIAIDLQATRGASATGSSITLRHFSVRKIPA